MSVCCFDCRVWRFDMAHTTCTVCRLIEPSKSGTSAKVASSMWKLCKSCYHVYDTVCTYLGLLFLSCSLLCCERERKLNIMVFFNCLAEVRIFRFYCCLLVFTDI